MAYRSWRSAAVPLLPLVLCGLSSLLASVCNVMPQGSCVKAWPRDAHQQDGYRGLAASEGVRACLASLGTGGPRSQALRVPGTGGAHAGSVAKFDFWGKIQKSGIRNSTAYRLPNSRKSNFATEPFNMPQRLVLSDAAAPGDTFHIAVFGINGPISAAPANTVWFREARVGFF
jgi:hypothetical protein